MRMRNWFINVAISFDGKISETGKQINISSEEDWKVVHQFRSEIAAIVVGANTIKVDNPSLKTKPEYLQNLNSVRDPVRVVLDRNGICDPKSKVFQEVDLIPTIWVTNSVTNIAGVSKIKARGLSNIMRDVNMFCDSIARDGDIMIEGGSKVINDFIDSGLISKLRLYRSQLILPNGVPLFPRQLNKKLTLLSTRKLGDGIEEIYEIN